MYDFQYRELPHRATDKPRLNLIEEGSKFSPDAPTYIASPIMSRAEKLQARLVRLESEFLVLVQDEFEDVVNYQNFWRRPFSFLARWPTDRRKLDSDCVRHVEMLDKMERDIMEARRKLGLELPGPVIAVIERFQTSWNEMGTKQREGEWVALTKRAIRDLDAIVMVNAKKSTAN